MNILYGVSVVLVGAVTIALILLYPYFEKLDIDGYYHSPEGTIIEGACFLLYLLLGILTLKAWSNVFKYKARVESSVLGVFAK